MLAWMGGSLRRIQREKEHKVRGVTLAFFSVTIVVLTQAVPSSQPAPPAKRGRDSAAAEKRAREADPEDFAAIKRHHNAPSTISNLQSLDCAFLLGLITEEEDQAAGQATTRTEGTETPNEPEAS